MSTDLQQRKISWYITHDDYTLSGIEDTGIGWAIVDEDGEILFRVDEYTADARERIELFQEQLNEEVIGEYEDFTECDHCRKYIEIEDKDSVQVGCDRYLCGECAYDILSNWTKSQILREYPREHD